MIHHSSIIVFSIELILTLITLWVLQNLLVIGILIVSLLVLFRSFKFRRSLLILIFILASLSPAFGQTNPSQSFLDEYKNPEQVKKIEAQLRYLKEISPSISHFANLQELDLTNNEIASVPPEVGSLQHLTILQLRENKLTEFPTEVLKLKNLKKLDLGWNAIPNLPADIGKMSSLQSLDLSWTQIQKLPESIGFLRNLRELNIIGCPISKLPHTMSKLKRLESLFIQGTHISKSDKQKLEIKKLLPNTTIIYRDTDLSPSSGEVP